MYCDKAVAEPHGDFVRGIGRVFDPVSCIFYSLLHVHGDAIGLDADIASGCTVLPRAPYIAEHPLVEFAEKIPIKDVALASIGPA